MLYNRQRGQDSFERYTLNLCRYPKVTKMTIIPECFYDRVWDHWEEVRDANLCGRNFVIRDKIPLPYFCNVSAFMKSPKRIVTVAINPNDDVFESTRTETRLSADETERRLSAYFDERQKERNLPSWFNNYKHILEGMESTYLGEYDSNQNTAIHVDLCSPIATNPTWGTLYNEEKNLLSEPGMKLFSSLMDLLNPDVVLVSISVGAIERLWGAPANSNDDTWSVLTSFDRRGDGAPRSPVYKVKLKQLPKPNGPPTLIIYGAPFRGRPFGKITTQQRMKIGECVRARMDCHISQA